MNGARPEGALLAGACAGLAARLGWNAWALRALFVLFLLIKPVWAVLAYSALAIGLHLLESNGPGRKDEGLSSPELSARSERIAELERRFRDLEERRES